jgi:phthiocerol/phenolphthiocerol synthesis type-I polyketide synthase E
MICVSTTAEPNAIAVIGMAGRFPGAGSVSALWDNLRQGRESIITLSPDMLAAAGVRDEVFADPSYVRRAPILDGIDEFDAEFFGFPTQVAQTMDPQHRLFLQCAWHALEDAGCDPARYDGSIGVFGTTDANGYLVHHLLSHFDPNRSQGTSVEMISLLVNNDKDYLATRVSHQFNLRGPSLTVQTACSSSLVAVHLACQSLLNGECDMALAGGVAIRIPHHVGYWRGPGSLVSAVGHCRPFDIRADGTVFGSGLAIIALKPMHAAIDDGDHIHAIIRGSAVNNDGSIKMGFAAPSASGQADVIAEAHAVAGTDASTVSYVETHGTGTPLGDPIEIEGLRRAFGVSERPRPGPCILGSVKSNIGHLDTASGITGLVKAILCLKHRAIPATLHFTSPNPELRLHESPFVVQREYGPWEWDGVRRAGVSSFGVGGTNVHLILEEAPDVAPPDHLPGPELLLLSARTTDAVSEARLALAAELSDTDQLCLSDVAFTLAGRQKHPIRMAAVVNDEQHAVAVLRASEHDNVFVGDSVASVESNFDRIVFLFPGLGAQYVGMAHGLYETQAVFAEHFDRCAIGFRDHLGIDLRATVFSDAGSDLERTDRAQPALFAVEYALAKLIESYGIRAAAVAGYSIGEFVAATLAGVFDLETAIEAVSVRARLMHAAPQGAMVVVPLNRDSVVEHLVADVDVAGVNDPGTCVVAGPKASVRTFVNRLAEQGITARRVRTTHAFHSRSMDSLLPELESFFSRVRLCEPRTPLLSNVTGTWMTADEATNPVVWARQVRATVRFADELDVMLADPCRVLMEVGPGGTLTASAIRHPRWSAGHRAVRLMRHQAENRSDLETFLLGLGQLWAADIDVDWTPLTGGARRRIVSLPGYPFAHQRHWVDPKSPAEPVARDRAAQAPSNVARGRQHSATNGQSQIEASLQRIWAQCLGNGSIDRNGNFFELGGDSLIAISVAMSATNEGLELTPQDLYEYPTVSALSAALFARYTTGGLAQQPPADEVNPPVPPTIAHFLENGVREAGRWRVPLILRVDPKIGIEDVCAVLTAVTNRHDALRLQLVKHAGVWEQHTAAQQEFGQLSARSLPQELETGGLGERQAILDILQEVGSELELSNTPLAAVYIAGSEGNCYLGITLHETACDEASREILITDIFTAFTQVLAGEDIVLQPATTTWREWSQRCAVLAAHPAVLEGRDQWLENLSSATLRVADQQITGPPHVDDLTRLSSTLTAAQTADVDDARRLLRSTVDDVLLAALSRTIAHAVGEGVVAVDLDGSGRSVLRPDVDVRRTVGRFTTIYPIALTCTTGADTSATQLFDAVRENLAAIPHCGIGYGLLRYNYAPTARLLAAQRPPDIHVCNLGTIPSLPSGDAPVQLDSDTAMPARETIPGLGHAIELRVYRFAGALHVDWWYDTRRLTQAIVDALAQHFPRVLLELTREAIESTRADDDPDAALEALALVDLSAPDTA